MDPVDEHFADLLEAGLPRQLCLTWCQGDDLEVVARDFGADLAGGLWADPDELEELEEEHRGELLQLTAADGWVIALEPQGFEGSRKEVLTRLSRSEQALSVYWNVEMDSAIAYADGGRVLTTFNLVNPDERTGDDPHSLDHLLSQVGLNGGQPTHARKARSLALGELISGRTLTPERLRAPQLVFTLTDPRPDALVPSACLNPRMPFLDEPPFARILAAPSVACAPDIVQMVVAAALPVAALEDGLAREVAARGEQGSAQKEALRARLLGRVTELRRRVGRLRSQRGLGGAEEAGRLESMADATFVLAEALRDDPMTAADAATAGVVNLSLPRADELRMRVLHNAVKHIAYNLRHPS
ncbi:DUF6461 domain-containing protein [Nonomuraea sp. B1E8]|uniref:DUF6461 domain-containing protein n=1 Tax=unclassified Nonomuraea TaxID=2593643 RepID=UPI00325D00D5